VSGGLYYAIVRAQRVRAAAPVAALRKVEA
jgi:hypothetical protein